MLKATLSTCLALALAGVSSLTLAADASPAPAAPVSPTTQAAADKPLAVVNGVPISPIHASILRRERAARGQPSESVSDETLRDALIASEVLAQETLKKPIDPTIQALLDFQRRDILGRAAIEEYARMHPIPEEVLKEEYEKAKVKAGTTEYHTRHILVDDEKTATNLLAQLKGKKKVKFEDLAKKHSKDSSAGNGGDLGWVLPANLVPEFADAMVAMKKGQISDKPVKTQFGWHILRLEETRQMDFPEYERLKPRIHQQLQQGQIRQWLKEMVSTARIE